MFSRPQVKVWDLATSNCVQTLTTHTLGVYGVAVTTDGQIVSGSNDNTVKTHENTIGYSEVGKKLLLAFQQQNSKMAEEVIELMVSRSNFVDLFSWVDWVEFEDNSTSPSQDISILFNAVWEVMAAAHLKSNITPELKVISEALQKSVTEFVLDVKKCRPEILSEFIQHYSNRDNEKLANTQLMHVLIKELSKGGVINIYYFEVAMFVAFMACFSRLT
mgnify:FL=1